MPCCNVVFLKLRLISCVCFAAMLCFKTVSYKLCPIAVLEGRMLHRILLFDVIVEC